MTEAKKKKGRPPMPPEIRDEILERIENGELLTEICKLPHMPEAATVRRWKREDAEFSAALMRARAEQQWTFADQLLMTARDESKDYSECVTERLNKAGEITAIVTEKKSDNTSVQRHRLICDQLYRLMQSLNASVFGPKEKIEVTGKDGKEFKPEFHLIIEK